MDVLANWMVGIPLQCTHMSNPHTVNFKYVTILFVTYASVKLERVRRQGEDGERTGRDVGGGTWGEGERERERQQIKQETYHKKGNLTCQSSNLESKGEKGPGPKSERGALPVF